MKIEKYKFLIGKSTNLNNIYVRPVVVNIVQFQRNKPFFAADFESVSPIAKSNYEKQNRRATARNTNTT